MKNENELLVHAIANNINYIDIQVNTIEEAIEKANNLKSEGYDLFRGQSGLWPIISNLNRLSEEERDQTIRKALILENILMKNCNFKSQDELIAAQQHYKLPTNFVDFTTEPKVAAYFTSQISGNEPNEYACIICLDSKTVQAVFDITKKDMPIEPEILDICVNNLLRQEAQKGKFLFLPFIGFELTIPYKRIVFKNSKDNANKFKDSDYYPTEKSELEIKVETSIQIMNHFYVI